MKKDEVVNYFTCNEEIKRKLMFSSQPVLWFKYFRKNNFKSKLETFICGKQV